MTATSIGFMSVRSCSGLVEGVRLGKSFHLHALVVDAHGGGHGFGIAIEVGERADHLRGEADVGEGGRVAVAKPAGVLFPGQVALDRLERSHGPVGEPAVARALVCLELFLQVIPYPGNDQGMPVRGGDQGKAAHARTAARVLREKRRLRMSLLQVLQDGERLKERRSAFVQDERRHDALRVHCQIVFAVLPAFEEVDGYLLGVQSLQGEGNAHTIARQRAPEAVELHGLTLIFASLMSLEYLSISLLMKEANCSGVLDTASTPRSAKRFLTSGSASAFTVSAFSFATIARGVPAGYSTPHQLTATSPDAASRQGGGSGRSS